jgi:hypothetical protein
MQWQHKTTQCNVNTKHHNAMSTQNNTMQCQHKTTQCNVNTKQHNAMSTHNNTMQCQHKTTQCNVNTKQHSAVSTNISTRNYYGFVLRVLSIVYLMPEDGYYGRNMLHVLRGLTIFVMGTLTGDYGKQIVICGADGEAYQGHSSVQHRKKWRYMVWGEGLRRGVEWEVLSLYVWEEGHLHIISVH